MSTRSRALIALPVASVLLALSAAAQTLTPTEPVDYDAIYRIKEEGFQRSQVMEIVSYLTDVYGPRLTGSPNIKQAADWSVKKLADWGASNPRIENWGTFGRGWVERALQRAGAHADALADHRHAEGVDAGPRQGR